jgi:hypothetical protein
MSNVHVWVTSKGIATTGSKEAKPYKSDPTVKVKYMGIRENGKGNKKGIRLSTGRVLKKPV